MISSAPASTATLNRSAPFIAKSTHSSQNIFLLDKFELSLDEIENNRHLIQKIEHSLDISFLGNLLMPEDFEYLLTEQFAAASEFVYGHPFWESVRKGSRAALFAYLLETRHYLAAAASRMSPSIAQGIGLSPLTLLLSRHLLEEWDHAKFFSEALELVGCSRTLSNSARPIPATLEWIHATRLIAYTDELSAAACSGFMEYSSTETAAVRSWHSMLVDSGLLPEQANRAIVGHLETDISFDHAENWKHALKAHGPITTSHGAQVLNSVAMIAEAIYRWLSALQCGCAGSIVYGMQILTEENLLRADATQNSTYEPGSFDGLPVWPSALMELVNSGNGDASEAVKIVSGLTFALGNSASDLLNTEHALVSHVIRNVKSLTRTNKTDLSSVDSLEATIASWLCSIDGHSLWDAMIENPDIGLISGYILENYHYLASAARHIGAAISTCTDTFIRLQLIEHLADELEHCELLEKKLKSVAGIESAKSMRPLSTTVAFVGFLENIGRQDWKAYILVSTFLQKSLSECRPDGRHSRFYEAIMQRNSTAGELLHTIWNHDDLDMNLGHDSRPRKRLISLVANEPVSLESLKHAAIAPALAWSFLDGIRSHYGYGKGSLWQRMGWRSC